MRSDEAFRAANRLGPPDPLPFERPSQFRARVLEDLSRYSPRWAGQDVSKINDELAMNVVEQQVLADAKAHGPTYGLGATEIKERETRGHGGHIVRDFVGGKDAWFGNEFRRAPRYGNLRSRGEYEQMTQRNLLSRITEIVPGWARTKVTGGRAAF